MDTLRRRTRSSTQVFGGREVMEYYPYLLDNHHRSVVADFQETVDEKHDWPNDLGPIWDVGGVFTSEKMEFTGNPMVVDLGPINPYRGYRYTGDLLPADPGSLTYTNPSHWSTGNLEPSSEFNLVAKGTQAVSRSAPTNPHASLSTTLGELTREGLPALSGLTTLKGRGKPSAVAGEYLNHEFGVRPLVSDVTALMQAVRKSKDILEQYYRDSGRVVRRKYAFPLETETTLFRHRTDVSCWPNLDYNFYSSLQSQVSGFIDCTRTTKKKTWFSGAFSYYAKRPDNWTDLREYAQQANHLLGVGITPATVWNLTPWSWATDWFANMGDVLNNASMMLTDGLVMRYGYIMEEYSNESTYTFRGSTLANGEEVRCAMTYKYTYKRRRAASPFGFGLTDADLSPKQWAIIAALGMTRGGPRTARTR